MGPCVLLPCIWAAHYAPSPHCSQNIIHHVCREAAHRASNEFNKAKEAASKALEDALAAAGDAGDASESFVSTH